MLVQNKVVHVCCRSPQGERGLKSDRVWRRARRPVSLPAGGAWIEMQDTDGGYELTVGRSPQGERGLKYSCGKYRLLYKSRSPQGERGLKYFVNRSFGQSGAGRSPQGERGLK